MGVASVIAVNEVEVRVLGPGDESVVAQSLEQWGQRPDPAFVDRFLSSPEVRAVAALDGDKLVGFSHGYLLPRADGLPMAMLYSLDVVPAYRRRGIATRMVQTFREAAGPVSRLRLVTDASNSAARLLYMSIGGTPVPEPATVYEWANPRD